MKITLLYCLFIIAAELIVPQQFSVSSDYFNIYKEHSESTSLDILYRNTEISSLFQFSNTCLSFNIGKTNSSIFWKTNQNNIQNNFEVKQNYSSISLFSRFNNIYIDSKGTLNNFRQKLQFDYTIRMGMISQQKNNVEFDLAFRKTSLPFSWDFSFKTSGFNINAGPTFYLTSVNSNISSDHLIFGMFLEKNILLNEHSSETYTMDAKPDYDKIRFAVKNKSDIFPVSFEVSRASLKMKTHLLMNDLQFSSINISDLSLFRINSDIEFNKFTLPIRFSFSYNFFSGNITGSAESWPFTDIIQSMIFNRINFKAFGSVKMIETSFYSNIICKALIIRPLIGFFYVDPELTIQTWQPVFLAFGIRDYSERSDQINYLLLGRAGGAADFDVGIATITLNINQFFPLLVNKEKHTDIASAAPYSSIPTSTAEKIAGGTFVSISLKRSF